MPLANIPDWYIWQPGGGGKWYDYFPKFKFNIFQADMTFKFIKIIDFEYTLPFGNDKGTF